MRGVEMVSVGGVRVMRGFFVSTGVVMFRGFLVMACRVFVMLRRFPMMLGCFLGHQALLCLPREDSATVEQVAYPSPSGGGCLLLHTALICRRCGETESPGQRGPIAVRQFDGSDSVSQ